MAMDVGVQPAAFWGMTFADAWLWVQVHQRRVERERESAAWIVCTLRQVNGDRTVTVDKLLGRRPKKTPAAVPGLPGDNDRLGDMLSRVAAKP